MKLRIKCYSGWISTSIQLHPKQKLTKTIFHVTAIGLNTSQAPHSFLPSIQDKQKKAWGLFCHSWTNTCYSSNIASVIWAELQQAQFNSNQQILWTWCPLNMCRITRWCSRAPVTMHECIADQGNYMEWHSMKLIDTNPSHKITKKDNKLKLEDYRFNSLFHLRFTQLWN